MAGKGRFKMGRQMKRESEALSSAGSKQSSWSKLGMGLGGLLAMGLTGGTATPLVAAMMAGGGTLAGGLLGRGLARGTKGGRMRGGRFYRDEAAKWKSEIGEDIWSGAGKAALKGGMASLGSGFTFGKEGLKVAIPGKSVSVGAGGIKTTGEGFKMGDIIKRGTETATYSDSLMGKLGKAIDIKGSLAAKGLGKIQSWQTGRELQGMGEASLGGGPSFAEGTGTSVKGPRATFGRGTGEMIGPYKGVAPSRRHAQFAPGEMTAIMEGNISPQSKIDMSATAAAAEAPIFGGDFDADRYRILKEGDALRKTEYLNSLAGSEGVLEPLSQGVTRPVVGTGIGSDEDIMGALMEGYNTPYGIPDLEGVGTGQGFDPASVSPQTSRASFMKELEYQNMVEQGGLKNIRPSEVIHKTDLSRYISPADAPYTGSKVSASQAQESAILQNELKDYQFSDQIEGFRSDAGSKRIPFSGEGEGFTQTSAWEGVGESFPVTSPEMVTGPYSRGTFGLPSTTRGYDFRSVAGKRHRDTLDSIRWHNTLFGDQYEL